LIKLWANHQATKYSENVTSSVWKLVQSFHKWPWLYISCTIRDKFSFSQMNKHKQIIKKICIWIPKPIVPANSTIQTSGRPSLPSTGIKATRSIHSWIASVMWGITLGGFQNTCNNFLQQFLWEFSNFNFLIGSAVLYWQTCTVFPR